METKTKRAEDVNPGDQVLTEKGILTVSYFIQGDDECIICGKLPDGSKGKLKIESSAHVKVVRQ